MTTSFIINLDRSGSSTLTDQIRVNIRNAILDGRLAPGMRLPSWRDLAVQLGVARGTVRAAYERLADEFLVIGAGSAGTRVAQHLPSAMPVLAMQPSVPIRGMLPYRSASPLPFQMGVPAQDAFPGLLWSRVRARAVRAEVAAPNTYPDPRGEPALRTQIASYLAIARGFNCSPDQIVITGGYRAALNLAVRALAVEGQSVWMEEPGYPIGRHALELCGMRIVPVPVDDEGLDVGHGMIVAPDAAIALVTPGQQAPLGVALSNARRLALLNWAKSVDAWIIEDDFLGDLQLDGRAAPALASMDNFGRVIHIGTFSKTMTPALGLGFLVAPPQLSARFSDVAACLAPALNATMQRALVEFLSNGHYMRHLRRMKMLYAKRREHLYRCLSRSAGIGTGVVWSSGLAVRLSLPAYVDDVDIAAQALARGLAPIPLSPWYAMDGAANRGLLLGVSNLVGNKVETWCETLAKLVRARLSEVDPDDGASMMGAPATRIS